LPFPQQIVQCCHAILEVGKSLLLSDCPHPHVVVIAISDERQLFRCLDRLHRLAVPHRAFHEPDRQNELTAIATGPIAGQQRQIFRHYRCLDDPDFG